MKQTNWIKLLVGPLFEWARPWATHGLAFCRKKLAGPPMGRPGFTHGAQFRPLLTTRCIHHILYRAAINQKLNNSPYSIKAAQQSIQHFRTMWTQIIMLRCQSKWHIESVALYVRTYGVLFLTQETKSRSKNSKTYDMLCKLNLLCCAVSATLLY